jgi:aspartyl-tRNA(Asn)/glutamyl-tRNA(Gln) amidotransferase subunit A
VSAVRELSAAVRAGEVHPVEAVQAALDAIYARSDLRAVVTLCDEAALARAGSVVGGRLAGVPLLVKDLIDVEGVPTTCGGQLHAGRAATATAPVVRALEAEGAIVVGKGACDEFAWGVTGQNPHYGDIVNPRAPDRIAGGSSAGSAAALAAGLVPLALGTDTGGSVRIPAACCGVVGFKPAHGTLPVDGIQPLCPSFDTVGPMATSAGDCALAHAVLRGRPAPDPGVEDLVVGVLCAHPRLGPRGEQPGRDGRALAHAARLEALGARVVEVELPVPEADVWPLFQAEAAATHRATFPAQADAYGPNIRAKLEAAQRVEAEAVAAARAAIDGWRARAVVEPAVDLLLAPTLGTRELPPAGVDELDVRVALSAYTRAFNYLGWPAIALGDVQLAGRDEDVVLAAALAWEGEA